jgi:hypothetical protein
MAVATTLPADPSRAKAPVRIHHHGSEAKTLATGASRLRTSSFIASPFEKCGKGEAPRKARYFLNFEVAGKMQWSFS